MRTHLHDSVHVIIIPLTLWFTAHKYCNVKYKTRHEYKFYWDITVYNNIFVSKKASKINTGFNYRADIVAFVIFC